MKKTIWLLLLGSSSLVGAPCTSAPLSTYTTGGFNCTLDQFSFFDFTFAVTSSSTGYTPLAASSINVLPALTPTAGGLLLGLAFNSTGFSVTGSDFVTYDIRYNIDPPPDEIIETSDQLNTNTPVFPGFADVVTNVCIGGTWRGTAPSPTCGSPGVTRTLHVFYNTPTTRAVQTFDATTFAGVHILGIDNFITLNANGGSSSITGLTNNTTAAPEPATVAFAAFGLALMAARRLRSKSS